VGLVEAPVFEVAHGDGPGLGALAVAVLDGQRLLDAVLADADHDQQAQRVVVAEPDRDVDTVDEQVRVAMEPEAAAAELLVLALPGLREPAERRR